MGSIKDWFQRVIVSLKDQTPVDDDNGLPVKVVNVDAPIELTGDITVDTLGALNDAKVVNPDAASATLPALARGQLKQQVDMLAQLTALNAAIGTAGDDAGDPTVIGLLKQIAENTAPA